MNETIDTLKRLEADGFWGQLQFDYQAGQIVLIRETKTIRPQSYGGNNPNGRQKQSNR